MARSRNDFIHVTEPLTEPFSLVSQTKTVGYHLVIHEGKSETVNVAFPRSRGGEYITSPILRPNDIDAVHWQAVRKAIESEYSDG